MKTLVGFISREMYNTQTKVMIAPDLRRFLLPLKDITSFDIGRKVEFDEESKTILIEPLKTKGKRQQNLFIIEKEEGRPIISVDHEPSN